MSPSRALISLGFFFLLTLGVAGPAKAEPKAKLSEIVYNKVSGSYFQYVLYPVPTDRTWMEARREAESVTYKGIRGRLAVVPDQNASDFLRRTFNPKTYVWIGLRYFCRYRKLMWVTGEILDRKSFQRWAGQWYRNKEVICPTQGSGQIGGMEYMPVYYTPIRQGFRWQASGWHKKFYGYFVEFPEVRE